MQVRMKKVLCNVGTRISKQQCEGSTLEEKEGTNIELPYEKEVMRRTRRPCEMRYRAYEGSAKDCRRGLGKRVCGVLGVPGGTCVDRRRKMEMVLFRRTDTFWSLKWLNRRGRCGREEGLESSKTSSSSGRGPLRSTSSVKRPDSTKEENVLSGGLWEG